MQYVAPDGHVIESNAGSAVEYTCEVSGYANGVYTSLETAGSGTSIGISQIKIERVVEDGVMTITVTESTALELMEYIVAAAQTEEEVIPVESQTEEEIL